MIALSQDRAKSLLALHGWNGVLLGLLLYAVILTGVVAVFADEIGDWSSPLRAETAAEFPPGLDARVRELATQVEPRFHEEVSLFPRAGGRIEVFFHRHVVRPGEAQPEEEGVAFVLHPQTLAVLDRREGYGEDIAARDGPNQLADFLVELHVSLHLPEPWGFFVTGMLGLAMLVAAVTGFLTHRHLLRELFTIRRVREALLARRDAHVIAASWNLPFAVLLAFTGSYFSFAGSVGIPVMAKVAFGGDQIAMIETLIGLPPPEDARASPLADLDAMLADARSRSGSTPTFAAVERYGRADARVTVFAPPADGELTAHNLQYEGTSGAFLREKPGLGLVPSTGGTLADLMGPLHFGNFAGVLSKAVWLLLGLACAYVVLSGMLVWTTRRAESPAWRRMAHAVIWMGYGLPLALALSAWGYFIGRDMAVATLEMPMVVALAAGALLSTLLTLWLEDAERLRRWLLAASGLALLLLPVLRLLTDGPGWLLALDRSLFSVMVGDVLFVVGGGLCLYAATRARAVVTHGTAKRMDAARVAA